MSLIAGLIISYQFKGNQLIETGRTDITTMSMRASLSCKARRDAPPCS
ncbi:hypothetical protein PO124_25515 [Bacillus licheniformis]|nr:hypothetical protein [Bacillus licheniformis]